MNEEEKTNASLNVLTVLGLAAIMVAVAFGLVSSRAGIVMIVVFTVAVSILAAWENRKR